MSNVRIETDSLVVVQLINEGNPNGHPQQALVADAQILMACTGAILSHTTDKLIKAQTT